MTSRTSLVVPLGAVFLARFLIPCSVALAEPGSPTTQMQIDSERAYRKRCEPYEGDARSWPSQTPLDADSPAMMAAFSHCAWTVSLGPDGGIIAKVHVRRRRVVDLPFTPSVVPRWQLLHCAGDASAQADPRLGVSDFLAVPGGFLVAYNSGEFGGGLYLYDAAGRLGERITTENAIRIFPEPHGALAFTGIAHMTIDSGHVVRLTYRAKHWHVGRVRLPGAPDVLLPERDGSYLLVTGSNLFRVTPQLRIVLLHRGSWRGNVAPNSIVQDSSGTVYLGMRYAVARLRPIGRGYLEDWLAPLGPRAHREESPPNSVFSGTAGFSFRQAPAAHI